MTQSVCIGFAEALSAPEVVWSLVDAGYPVVAFARRGHRSALRQSRHVRLVEITPPESDYEAALTELNEFLVSWGQANPPKEERVLLPLDDAALWLCSRADLAAGWVCAGPRGSGVELAVDKWMQVQTAGMSGLRVPETTLAKRPEDVFDRATQVPLILKPAHALWVHGRRLYGGKVRICADRRELNRAVADWDAKYPLLVQPFIRGTGEGVFGLATNDGIQAWSAHRRLRMANPQGSGSSACVSQPVPLELRAPIENFIRVSGWRGLFMVELLRDREGTVWFVEFNGRSWGSMALSRRRGLEYPAWSVNLAVHPEAPVVIPSAGNEPIVCRHIGREMMHLLFVLRGPRSKALNEWPRFWPTLVDVLRVRRTDSFYNWRGDDKRVFLTDWWYTIRNAVFKSRS